MNRVLSYVQSLMLSRVLPGDPGCDRPDQPHQSDPPDRPVRALMSAWAEWIGKPMGLVVLAHVIALLFGQAGCAEAQAQVSGQGVVSTEVRVAAERQYGIARATEHGVVAISPDEIDHIVSVAPLRTPRHTVRTRHVIRVAAGVAAVMFVARSSLRFGLLAAGLGMTAALPPGQMPGGPPPPRIGRTPTIGGEQ